MTDSVVLIGIDGLRWDVLCDEPTPHLDRLAAEGFGAPARVPDDCPTISGPAWATILTGTLPVSHGIYDNDLSTQRLDQHPHVFALAAEQRPDVRLWAGSGWLPLVAEDSGGPVFPGGYAPPGPQAHTRDEWEFADQDVTDATVAQLDALEGPGLLFCYLGGVDEVAHELGVAQDYREFTRLTDSRVGQVLDAVDRRRSLGESWTVLAVTDHGHVDAGGHGGDSDLERTAWVMAAGPGIGHQAPDDLLQADIAAHICDIFGLKAPDGVVGQPLSRA